jgi:hypothetical protein
MDAAETMTVFGMDCSIIDQGVAATKNAQRHRQLLVTVGDGPVKHPNLN